MSPKIELPDSEVHAWFERFNCTDALLAEARATLSKAENERAHRFLQDIHRNRYLISHLKLRKILAKYLAIAPRELQFRVTEFGKPFLAPSGNPSQIHFNLSHSGNKMLLGVVRNASIGVDIEEIRPESATFEVAARFFTERENHEIQTLSAPAQTQAFFNCWTRKEAYLKALGCGLSIDPKECEVSLLPTEPPILRKPAPIKNKSPWSLFSLTFENSIAAIALDQPRTLKQKSG